MTSEQYFVIERRDMAHKEILGIIWQAYIRDDAGTD